MDFIKQMLPQRLTRGIQILEFRDLAYFRSEKKIQKKFLSNFLVRTRDSFTLVQTLKYFQKKILWKHEKTTLKSCSYSAHFFH